jgi:carboxymethylenebutenolidase
VTPQPNSPHLLVAKTKSSYLCCVAKNDDARAPTDKDVLKKALDDAKRPNTVEVYGGDHGWTVPGSAVYNQAEAERAWAALTALYKKNLA